MALTVRADLYDPIGDALDDVAGVSAWAARRGQSFDGPEADQEAAIIQAQDYIDTRYKFRVGIVGVPKAAVNALAFLAVVARTEGLSIKPTAGLASGGTAGGQVTRAR